MENNNLGGIDYSQYNNWELMQAPNGQKYYVVPGTGYIYDPFLSQAKGRPVLFDNPKPQLEARKKQEDLARQQNSFGGQATQLAGPAIGSLAGAAALKYGDRFAEWSMSPTPPVSETVPTAPPSAPIAPPTPAGQAFQSSVNAPTPVGSAPDGGTLMSDGSVSAGSDSAGAAAPLPNPMGATPFYVPAAVAAGTIATGKYAYDRYVNGNKDADKTPSGKYGRAQLAFTTMGASELANAVGFNHEGTKEAQKRRWGGLIDKGIKGADVGYAANHPEGDDGTWKTGKYAGQKWTFDKAQDLAKDDPSHFRLAEGNFATFGNDWSSYNDQQKDSIISGLINAGLYDSKKGDIIVTDQDKARQIKDQVLNVTKPAATPAAPLPMSPVDLGKKLGTRINKK